jgi:hypothetical protein
MLLALTCALCAAQPVQVAPTYAVSPEVRLVLAEDAPAPPASPLAPDLQIPVAALNLDQAPLARDPLLPLPPAPATATTPATRIT